MPIIGENSKTESNEGLQEQIVSQVDSIIEKHLPAEVSSKNIRKQIWDAIYGDKQKALFLLQKYNTDLFNILPEKLKQDTDIIESLLREKPETFQTLSSKQKANHKFQDIVFSDMLKKQIHIGKILEFLDVFSQKDSARLKGVFQKALENKKYIFSESLSEMIYNVYISEPENFSLLKDKNIFQNIYANFSLSKIFTSFITQKINTKQKNKNKEEIFQEEIFSYIQEFLGIHQKNLSENITKLLQALGAGISIPKIQSKKAEQEAEENQKGENGDNDDKKEELGEQEYQSIGPYYTASYGSSSSVWDNSGNSINLETNILESMSEKSLENYVKFSRMMQDIGLGFLLKKHSRLLQIATDTNFYEGSGMTEGKVLKLLNSVGKNIGIPQSSYEDSEGNKKTSCFQTTAAAKMHFGNIQSSGKIGDFYQDPARRGDQDVVEIFMKDKNIITEPYGELSVSSWGNIHRKKSEESVNPTLLAA